MEVWLPRWSYFLNAQHGRLECNAVLDGTSASCSQLSWHACRQVITGWLKNGYLLDCQVFKSSSLVTNMSFTLLQVLYTSKYMLILIFYQLWICVRGCWCQSMLFWVSSIVKSVSRNSVFLYENSDWIVNLKLVVLTLSESYKTCQEGMELNDNLPHSWGRKWNIYITTAMPMLVILPLFKLKYRTTCA